MPRMLKELKAKPEIGLLGAQSIGFTVVQYWRSFEALERYARSADGAHWPAWIAFNERVGGSRGDVGIWHETYRIAAGEYEAVYSGMPAYGLGSVGTLVPARERLETVRGRLGSASRTGAADRTSGIA